MKLLKLNYQSILVTIFIVLLCGLLLGCTQNPPAEPIQPKPSDGPVDPAPTPAEPTASFEAYSYQDNTITFSGYNTAADQTETYTYRIPADDKSTLATVLDAYNTDYKVPILQGEPIAANSITLKEGKLTIDFTPSIYGNYGSGTEAALLGNLLMSFFDNIPEVEEIYISVNQQAYETGHNMYKLDEPITKADIS